eukprot:m.531374 g.531374  ORF g.531374 m.531374 type:complete len:793 (-) comp22031_c0_seq6:311-2689(-)
MVDADTMMADEPTHAGGGSWTMPGQHTEHITIQLEPSGLGMQVQPLASGGVVVAKIFPGKSAHRDGRLRTGDVLLQINETDMTAINNREMTTVFRDAMTQPEISLVVARPNKRSTAIHQRDSLVSTASTARDGASQAGTHEDVVEHTHHMDSDEHPPRATRQGSGGSQNARMTDIRPREIRLPVTQTGLDIAITRGPKDARRNTTICVQWVNPTGNVGRDGRIKQRDVLLTIDGHSLLNVSTEEAIRLLSLARGPAEAEGTTAVTVPLHDGAALGIVLEGGFADDVDPASGGGGGVYTPIRVKEVVHGSAGYAAGVTPGCEVVSINGRSLDGVTLDRATTILSVAKLRSASAGVTLVLRTGSFVTLQYLPMSGDGGSQRRSPASLQHPDVSRASVHSRRRDSDGGNSDGGRSDSSVGSRSQRSGLARADDDGVTATHLAFDGVDPNVPSSGPLSVADADRLRDAYARAVADRDSLRGALLAERNKRAMVQNKLDLATAARDAARTVEHDYDEIVTLLEAEVAHLRAQLLADPDDRHRLLIDYRKRCVVLGCQLNKAVEAKRVADEAIRVLANFTRTTKDNLQFSSQHQTRADQSLNARRDGSLRARPLDGPLPPPGGAWAVGDACMAAWTDDGGDGKLHTGVVESLRLDPAHPEYEHCLVRFTDIGDGGDGTGGVVQTVATSELRPLSKALFAVAGARALDLSDRAPDERSFLSPLERLVLRDASGALERATAVLEADVLPFGYEEAFTSDGTRYYIDHVNQTTTWQHPSTKRLPSDTPLAHLNPMAPQISA